MANEISKTIVSNRNQYLRELGNFHKERRLRNRDIALKDVETVMALQQIFGVVPRKKERARTKELIDMIGMVLDTGNSGAKVIKAYALQEGKDDQWRKDIAKPKAGKSFEVALASYLNHPEMVAIEKNPTYCQKMLLSQTVTGALTLLSKYVIANREIEAKELENQKLKEMLELKDSLTGKAPDWELAKQLRSEGKTIRQIAQVLGVGRSTVHKYLTKG